MNELTEEYNSFEKTKEEFKKDLKREHKRNIETLDKKFNLIQLKQLIEKRI